VLVTGGTGTLGRALVPRLVAAGHHVRVMSRRPITRPGVEAVYGDLATVAGLAEAVAGADVVVHAASSPARNTEAIDVRGTARLLQAARTAGVAHLIYVSIVGIDRLVHQAARLPVLLLPTDFRFQPIDPGEVARRLVELSGAAAAGRVPDIGGPQVRTLGELMRAWLLIRGLRRPVWRVPLPGRFADTLRRGLNTVPGTPYGRMTWEEQLQGKYVLSAGQGGRDHRR
jgi:uncharacterized protein YbjT (DUF2867 family)